MKKKLSGFLSSLKKNKWYIVSSLGVFVLGTTISLFSLIDDKQLVYSIELGNSEVSKDINSMSFVNRVNNIENVFSELNYNTSLSDETDGYIFAKLVEIVNIETKYTTDLGKLGVKMPSSELDKFKKEINYKERSSISGAEKSIEENIIKVQAYLDYASVKLKEEALASIKDKDLKDYYEKNRESFYLGKKIQFKVARVESLEEAEKIKAELTNGASMESLVSDSDSAQVYLANVNEKELSTKLEAAKKGDILIVNDFSVQSIYQITNLSDGEYEDFEHVKEEIETELISSYIENKLKSI